MSVKKSFPSSAVLGAVTGKCLGNFAEIHEVSEWIVGHSIWTHEFAERKLWERIRDAVALQFGKDKVESWCSRAKEVRDEKTARLYLEWAETEGGAGKSMEVKKGTESRDEDPLESAKRIVGDKPIVAVVR
jgi:hypothetical protein